LKGVGAMFFETYKSLNYDERSDGVVPYILLMHYTGMETMEAARERLCDLESKVSAHYLIDEDGSIYSLIPESKRAWHAGASYWHGDIDINSASIGIELVNKGHEFGYRAFPDAQMQSLLELSRKIMSSNNITHVLGHSDVAPERKADPGELFNWQWLAEQGIGIWPDPTDEEFEQAQKLSCNDYDVERLFTSFGYNPIAAYIDVVTAFHRHFYPEAFINGTEGQVCAQSMARLLSIIRQTR